MCFVGDPRIADVDEDSIASYLEEQRYSNGMIIRLNQRRRQR